MTQPELDLIDPIYSPTSNQCPNINSEHQHMEIGRKKRKGKLQMSTCLACNAYTI